MAQFGYLNRRQMEPRPGRSYATEYYRQSAAERRRVKLHVERTITAMGRAALDTPGACDTLIEPLGRFRRRETQGAYSALDIMEDMWRQLQSGRDLPSGMLGRWNRLFEGTGREIDMIPESQLPSREIIDKLFGAPDEV